MEEYQLSSDCLFIPDQASKGQGFKDLRACDELRRIQVKGMEDKTLKSWNPLKNENGFRRTLKIEP